MQETCNDGLNAVEYQCTHECFPFFQQLSAVPVNQLAKERGAAVYDTVSGACRSEITINTTVLTFTFIVSNN